MINIEKITEKEIEKRFGALSENLKRALDSRTNLQIVNQVCKNHYINDEEKVLIVRQIVALVLLGFVHSYDMPQEINAELELNNPKLSDSIAKELDAKIFSSIKDELENNYQPIEEEPKQIYAPATDEKETVPGPAPISMDSISSPQVDGIIKPQTAPVPVPAPAPPALKPEIPVPVASIPIVKKPTQLPQSMIQPKQPVRATPPPNLPVLSGVEVPVSKTPDTKPMEKVAVLAQKEPAEQLASAPFILHQETESQPLAPTGTGFKVSLSEEQFGKMEQKWTPPPKAAQIETSFVYGEPSRTTPQPKPAESRVVHYSEMKTPVAPKPPMVSEPTIPKPPTPPAPPAPGYKTSQPAQPRFPVSQPEQKMPPQPTNPFGISDRNNKAINLSESKPVLEIPPKV